MRRFTFCMLLVASLATMPAMAQEKLDAMVAYSLKKIPPMLDKVESLIDAGDLPNAKVYLESAQNEWDMIHKDFATKFDPNHPDIVAVGKRLKAAKTKVAGGVPQEAPDTTAVEEPAASDELDAMVAHSLSNIPPALDKVESMVNQGDLPNAKVYLESAQNDWDMIHKDFATKFNPNHPDIVAVEKRLMAVTAKFAAVSGAAVKEPAVTEAPTGPSPNDPLPAAMVYEMEQFGNLDYIRELVKNMEVQTAVRDLESAQNEWNTKKDWNKGKFHPQNPDVLALDAVFAEVTKAVQELAGKASDATENLPQALEAVAENGARLYETHDQASSAIRDLSSLRNDFDRGSEEDISKLRARMDAVRVLVERVNNILPDSLAAANAFREQYPDFNALDKLVREGTNSIGREAGNQVERIETFPENWLTETRLVIDEALSEARNNIQMYGTGRLDSLRGSDEAIKTSAADAAEHWVLDYSSVMLEMVDTLLPELPPEAQAVLPELVASRQDYVKQAEVLEAEMAPVEKALSEIRQEVVNAAKRRLAGARFPKSDYTSGEWKDAEKDIRAAWAKKITDKELLKVSIYSPWEERTEARWRNDHWVVGTYRYIGANCLAKLASGKYMVYRMMFRNTMQANSGWSELEQWSVGHVYEILGENIDK